MKKYDITTKESDTCEACMGGLDTYYLLMNLDSFSYNIVLLWDYSSRHFKGIPYSR